MHLSNCVLRRISVQMRPLVLLLRNQINPLEPACRQATPPAVAAGPALAGQPESQVAYEVLGESSLQTRLDIGIARGLTPFVGREAELALLRDRWRGRWRILYPSYGGQDKWISATVSRKGDRDDN